MYSVKNNKKCLHCIWQRVFDWISGAGYFTVRKIFKICCQNKTKKKVWGLWRGENKACKQKTTTILKEHSVCFILSISYVSINKEKWHLWRLSKVNQQRAAVTDERLHSAWTEGIICEVCVFAHQNTNKNTQYDAWSRLSPCLKRLGFPEKCENLLVDVDHQKIYVTCSWVRRRAVEMGIMHMCF